MTSNVPVEEASHRDIQRRLPVGEIAVEIQGERITNEVVNRILPHLSDMQQEILFLLMKGCGVRETGREVGITHPAVIKHRRKIVRIATRSLPRVRLSRRSRALGITSSRNAH